MVTGKRVGVISLGCDKNRVDTEKMIALLKTAHTLTDDPLSADIIIVNTCAFLASARKESVREILNASALKNSGTLEKVIVTGCLPQKYSEELYTELSEADAFLGTADYSRILDVIDALYGKEERLNAVGCGRECGTARVLTTEGYAYLKIADGCDNRCTYCLIPTIRGKYRSYPLKDLVKEAKGLGKVKELILVAQDTTRYGADLTPKSSLTELIRALSALKNVGGIRLLYCYPESVTEELIKEIAENPKVIKYIDIPLQHADDVILKRMNRRGSGEEYLSLIERLKNAVKGIAIRSTFITGFPTETDAEFSNLSAFLEKAQLFNAGFFAYSREEGTPAYRMEGQVAESVKRARLKKLYSLQKKISRANLKGFVGKTLKVIAEGFDKNALCYYGRAYFNAPDVDGKVYFFSAEEVTVGEYYDVYVKKSDAYDLYGERV